MNQGIEIWRRAKDAKSASTKVTSPLREPLPLAAIGSQMQEVYTVDQDETNPTKRGVYVPHGFLHPASDYRFLSYRFKGTLAAVVDISALHTVVLYNIEEGTLIRSFDLDMIIRNNLSTEELHVDPVSFVLLDLDLSSEYICAAFDWALVVIPLENAIDATAGRAIVYVDKVPGTRVEVQQSIPRLVNAPEDSTMGPREYAVQTQANSTFVTVSCAHTLRTFAVKSTDLQKERNLWNPGTHWSPCFVSGNDPNSVNISVCV